MVSNGDSKAFSAVGNIYDEVKVVKIDYVSHAQKRMGKHFLNLKAEITGELSDGKTIGEVG